MKTHPRMRFAHTQKTAYTFLEWISNPWNKTTAYLYSNPAFGRLSLPWIEECKGSVCLRMVSLSTSATSTLTVRTSTAGILTIRTTILAFPSPEVFAPIII